MPNIPETPPVLDAITDKVLRYHPKDKGKSAKRRKEEKNARE